MRLLLIKTKNNFIMKQTSSHTSSVRGPRREKDHLEIVDRSEEPQHIERIKEDENEDITLPIEMEMELEMNIQKYSEEVKDELRFLLMDLLKYPSTKQAFRHRCANRLGYNDLKNIKNKFYAQSTYVASTFHPDRCQDCGLLMQERQIPNCSSIWEFPTAGPGTYNLFKYMKTIMGMLLFLGIIYSIVNLYANITYVNSLGQVTGETFPVYFMNLVQILNVSTDTSISLLMIVSAFLLIITVIVWWFLMFVILCISQKYEREIDQAFLSASDFSIMLENVPIHETEAKLKQQFDRYFQSLVFNHNIKNTWGEVLKPFTIKKICRTLPFLLNESQMFDKQLEGLDRDIVEKKKLFADWVLEMKLNSRFTYRKSQREREYANFERMLDRRKNKLREMQIKAREQYERANDRIKTTIIVSFDFNQSADIIATLNPQTLPAKIRYYLSCFKSTQYFQIRDVISNSESDVIASRAPEPEDIIWGNVAVPISVLALRKLLTWALMIVLSGILLSIIYGISFAQKNGTGVWSSIFIGFLVAFFNLITKFTLRKISIYEKDFTETDRQRGILLKALFVMAFNWTVPLAITNVANENENILGLNGYAYEIYWISLFECLLPPLIRIFDPQHFFRIIYCWWKAKPENKMILKQSELNDIYQHSQYQLGWCYVYFLDVLFFSCFYVSLYPGVIIFSLSGCFFMFWAEKYTLLNRSQRPEKVAKTLTGTAETLLSMSPFILWMGHIIWVNSMIKDYSSSIFTGDMILMSISLLYFITPWRAIHACFCHIPEEEILSFDQCNPRFPTQYDKLNPAFLSEGYREYSLNILDKKRKDDDNVSNKSNDNLAEPFDTRYVLQQISKIPSIFGRKNEVSRKVDREEDIKPRNLKGQDIQLLISQKQQGSPINQGNSKVYVRNPSPSPQSKKRTQTEGDLLKGGKETDQDQFSHQGGDNKVLLNMSSNGNTFGKKKANTDKRKNISVVDKPEDYEYQRKSAKQ